MSYRGSDLNLQQRSSDAPSDVGQGGPNGAHSPLPQEGPTIDVDETVLASCNHAYDAASLHGSPEVRLFHLLHALTRIPAAAEVLERRGIRAEHLRREMAMAMAAEEPHLNGDAPRTSLELAEVLHHAAEQASLRHGSASVDDVLKTVIAGDRDSPAATLLMRAAADPEQFQRWREELRRQTLHAEPSPAPPRNADVGLGDVLLQRMQALDASLRSLQTEAVADRKALRELMQDVRRELRANGAHSNEPLSGDQVGRIEAALEARAGELAKALASLGERFTSIDKLAADDWAQLNARMEGLTASLLGQGADITGAISTTLSERLDRVEAGLQGRPMPGSDAAGEQFVSLEAAVRAHLETAAAATKARERELGEVYEALVKLGANQQTLGNNLNTWRLENSGDLSIISNKLEQLEQTTLGVLTRINAEFQSLREEEAEGTRRPGTFKRWLYGTSSVLADNWRQEAKSIRNLLPKRDAEKKS